MKRNLTIYRYAGIVGALCVPAVAAALTIPHDFVNGEVLTAQQLNDNFDAISVAVDTLEERVDKLESDVAAVGAVQIVYLKDVKLTGTSAGDAPSGTWVQRNLNSKEDPIGHTWVTLNANQFSLDAGVYEVYASVPSHWCNYSQARLRDVTNDMTVIVSSSGQTSEREGLDGQATITTQSVLMGLFSVAAPTTFEIQSRVGVSSGNAVTLGKASSMGEVEVFTQVRLARVAD
jgi:outer membrane murein-binding lipoprotein Lpp